MSSEIDEFRASLVAAVQAELERHASAVVAEVDRIREENKRERSELKDQLRTLAQIVEQSNSRSDNQIEKLRANIDQRIGDVESRQTRRLDDLTSGLESFVQTAARPILQQARDDQEVLARKVEGLDSNLRRFDEQAARMVTFFNDMTEQIEVRQEELSSLLKDDIEARMVSLQKVVEDNDSAIRRFTNEVGQAVSQKINDAEDRFNGRLLAAESRMKEDAGQKIAEIDVHVGRVSAGLDETMLVLNDRIAGMDTRFAEADRRVDDLAASIAGIDQNAIDELKEKMSSAVGEAMLVRIEMERLEKAMNEKQDGLGIRITEVEQAVQDATMDVSTAVQLDRLEEIERALTELDPSKFVLKDAAQDSSKNGVKFAPPSADALSDGASAPVTGLAD